MKNNKKAMGTVVGTIMFLAILLFFLTQIILWSNQVMMSAEESVSEKMNSAVGIEITVGGGSETFTTGCYYIDAEPSYWDFFDSVESDPPSDHTKTHSLDGSSHTIYEDNLFFGFLYQKLAVTYSFETGINSTELKKIAAVTIHIYASYEDGDYEPCSIFVRTVQGGWIDTGEDVLSGFRWINITLENPELYINPHYYGELTIRFDSDNDGLIVSDTSQGCLKIDYMDVRAEPVALKVTALGGVDTHLVRLWIIEEETNNHTYRNLDVWVPAGTSRILTLEEINYTPSPGEVMFKILEENGNMDVCTHTFPETPTPAERMYTRIDIDRGESGWGLFKRAWAEATVTVVDENGSVVEGATVYVRWDYINTFPQYNPEKDQDVTGSGGTATFQSQLVWKWAGGEIIFTICDVTKPGWVWDYKNSETTDHINV